MRTQIRSPKSETRKKLEIRRPKALAPIGGWGGKAGESLARPSPFEGDAQTAIFSDRTPAPSGFGFRPSFEPRVSDFGFRRKSALSRRDFILRTALASSAAALAGTGALRASAAEPWPPPVVVFSKIYQDLKLNFEESAALTAEAGLEGIDCAVRPGGEILPENAAQQMPQYAALLRQRGLQMPLLSTGITGVASPHAQDILRTAKQLGVQYYRLGFINKQADAPPGKQVSEFRAQLKDLVPLNQQLGLGAVLENHSASGRGYVGGDLSEMYEVVKDFDPAQIGVAFDIGHAMIAHGEDWRRHFERLKSHVRVTYVKDVKHGQGWLPFGQGDLGSSDYFKLLNPDISQSSNGSGGLSV